MIVEGTVSIESNFYFLATVFGLSSVVGQTFQASLEIDFRLSYGLIASM